MRDLPTAASHFLPLVLSLLCILTASPLAAAAAAQKAQSPSSSSTEYTSDDAFRAAVLNVTNSLRKQHNATSLTWNASLADVAARWSAGCKFEHSGGPTGENLAAGYPNATASLAAWGSEGDKVDFKHPLMSPETGHFTQLVWKATTSVGCGRTLCDGKDGGGAPGWYVVCEYFPAGNVLGKFPENVQGEVKGEGDGQCMLGAKCSGAGAVGLDVVGWETWRWWVLGGVWGMVWGVMWWL